MQAPGTSSLVTVVLIVCLYLVTVVYWSRQHSAFPGILLPVIFAGLAVYNLLKPILIPNPYPTMQEGMLMTFFGALSIIGFALFAATRYLVKRRR